MMKFWVIGSWCGGWFWGIVSVTVPGVVYAVISLILLLRADVPPLPPTSKEDVLVPMADWLLDQEEYLDTPYVCQTWPNGRFICEIWYDSTYTGRPFRPESPRLVECTREKCQSIGYR